MSGSFEKDLSGDNAARVIPRDFPLEKSRGDAQSVESPVVGLIVLGLQRVTAEVVQHAL